MKKYALLITFCMLASMSGTYAQAQTSSSTGDQKIYKNVNDEKTHRPRIPSHESIGFMYQNGECYFSMPEYVAYIDVTLVSKTGEVYTSCVYAAVPIWSIALNAGEYEITCESDEGSHFSGTIWID